MKPNATVNKFFGSYLLYFAENTLEIYLWDLLQSIYTISFAIDGEYGKSYVVVNQNNMGAFEHILPVDKEVKQIIIFNINCTK